MASVGQNVDTRKQLIEIMNAIDDVLERIRAYEMICVASENVKRRELYKEFYRLNAEADRLCDELNETEHTTEL